MVDEHTVKEVLDIAVKAYPDILPELYDEEGNERPEAEEIGKGDTLALFIMREIQSVLSGSVTAADLDSLVTALDEAQAELDRVTNEIIRGTTDWE